jgi:hypothetical protein
MKYILTVLCVFSVLLVHAQKASVRGFVFDKATGEPVPFALVEVVEAKAANMTDMEGFFTISGIEPGTYTLQASFMGYDTARASVALEAGKAQNQSFYLAETATQLLTVEVSAEKQKAKETVNISKTTVTAKDIIRLPSVGGSPDLAQYLQVIPGIIFTGDQGGQLYVRGGAPIQNKCLIDGMTIYNPFHSIGFYSVFETDIIRNVDVYTGGFNAEYGGRTSAIIDVTTREGNKKRFGGKIEMTPFMAKALLEGPIVKLNEKTGNSLSFLVTGKHSYLSQTSRIFYPYLEQGRLPFNFTDIYGKLSYNSGNGSRLGLFGFSYTDRVNFEGVADYDWSSYGMGTNFKIIPGEAKMIIGGAFSFTNYKASLQEADQDPRSSAISSFNGGLDFTVFGKNSELRYGFEIMGFKTDFSYVSDGGQGYQQILNTPEVGAFMRYRKRAGALVFEPGLRLQFYPSIGATRLEPRLGLKVNISDNIRIKFAGGIYSQNLISAVNERDIVNFFVGFLAGPDEAVYNPGSTEDPVKNKLQTSVHAIGGVEFDLGRHVTFNVEPYWKGFPQLINLNRNKLTTTDPDYVTETGDAYGVDFSAKYSHKNLYVYLAYSHGYVKRNDGTQTYFTHFDRRHNINFVASYEFGKRKNEKDPHPFEVSARWNLGSGFPFTLTQGFYPFYDFGGGINSNYAGGGNSLGVIYDAQRNTGRLPYYHRLDISIKYRREFGRNFKLEATAGATNVYDRANIFYFDRIRYERVNQLPILPSVSVSLSF